MTKTLGSAGVRSVTVTTSVEMWCKSAGVLLRRQLNRGLLLVRLSFLSGKIKVPPPRESVCLVQQEFSVCPLLFDRPVSYPLAL